MQAGDRKKLIVSAAVIAAIFAGWIFISSSTCGRTKSIEGELEAVKNNIETAKSRGNPGNTGGTLPSDKELSLKFISDAAISLGIDVIKAEPGSEQLVLDADNSAITLGGKRVMEVPVSLEMKAGYKVLADYLAMLKKDKANLIKVQGLSITRDNKTSLKHAVNLKLSLYIVQ